MVRGKRRDKVIVTVYILIKKEIVCKSLDEGKESKRKEHITTMDGGKGNKKKSENANKRCAVANGRYFSMKY